MTPKFDTALSLALEAHAGQIRKGTENALGLPLPYITHPVAVATLVQRYGGNEDQVIAALLHDVLEDGGPQWAEPIRDVSVGEILEGALGIEPGKWTKLRGWEGPETARRMILEGIDRWQAVLAERAKA